MTKVVKYWNLGRIHYDQSNKIQNFLSKRHKFGGMCNTKENLIESKDYLQNTPNILLLMEHDPVYTAGLRDCLTPEEQSILIQLGADYRRTDRGGLVTFHGPGQLTAYPVLNLRHFKPSVRWYVCRLEELAIKTCEHLGITAERSPNTGVWVGDNKICAIGVHMSRGVSSHGIALNCNTNLNWFNHIVPCGIKGKGVTSLTEELKSKITIEDILPTFFQSFEDVFDCKLIPIAEEEIVNILDAVS